MLPTLLCPLWLCFSNQGLRALYFALAGAMSLFHKLHVGLAFILVFIGVKMVLADVVKIPIGIALGVVGGILMVSIAASLLFPAPDESTKPGAEGITKR